MGVDDKSVAYGAIPSDEPRAVSVQAPEGGAPDGNAYASHAEYAGERLSPNTVCRNCHDADPAEDLIAPCSCSGSMRWVHRGCLDEWRSVSPNSNSFWMCEVCNSYYKMEEKRTHGLWWSYLKAGLLVARDVVVLLILCQLVVLAIWGIGTLAHLENLEMPEGYHLLPNGLSTELHNFLASYYIFFFLVGCIVVVGLILTMLAWFCNALEECCTPSSYTYDTYNYRYPTYAYYWHLWYFPPTPVYHHHHHHHHHSHGGDCGCGASDCGGGGDCGGCDCKGDVGEAAAVIIIILIVIGIIVSVLAIFAFIFLVGRKHFGQLSRRSETRQLVVVDLSQDVV